MSALEASTTTSSEGEQAPASEKVVSLAEPHTAIIRKGKPGKPTEVGRVVWPKPGAKSAARMAYEQQRWFRCGHNWRSGMEGRISGLKRRHKLDHCRYHGDASMERWIGWGVIAHDLRIIAKATAR